MNLAPDTLRELLDYHYYRREMVYHFVSGMNPGDFSRPLNAGWGSIRGLLVHCLECELFWVQHRIRGAARPNLSFDDFPDVGAVRAFARQVREQTQAFVAALSADDLGCEVSATYEHGTLQFTVAKALMHVITHDVHHRGQVLLLGRQLGYQPLELDML